MVTALLVTYPLTSHFLDLFLEPKNIYASKKNGYNLRQEDVSKIILISLLSPRPNFTPIDLNFKIPSLLLGASIDPSIDKE